MEYNKTKLFTDAVEEENINLGISLLGANFSLEWLRRENVCG